MWGWFGGSQTQKKEAPKKAILTLREHISTLNKKSTFLQTQIQQQDKIARANITKDKTQAKFALKKKKKLENDLMKIENQVESLETQLNAIESANLNLETMKAMKQGAKAMKQMHGDFNIDKVDQTMDEIKEQVELSEDISDAISRPLGNDMIDDDELEDELAALQQEELDTKMTNTKVKEAPAPVSKVSLPDAPKGRVESETEQESEDEDEKALKALQAEMGL